MQLQVAGDDNKRRYYVRLIGYLPGNSVIVTTPRVDRKIMLVREGQIFVTRLLAGNTVYGFTASVLRACTRPYPYLHLSYPVSLESIVVRQAQRIPIRLIVAVTNEEPAKSAGKPQAATVVDMSTGGALVNASESLGVVGDIITIAARFEVAGEEQYLDLSARIRNVERCPVKDDPTRSDYQHGVEFQLLEDSAKLALHRFVYENLVKTIG